jgi:hypothetical protein
LLRHIKSALGAFVKQGRDISKGDADGRTDGAAAFVRARRIGRRVLTRFLPGSVAVVAALTIPEFSVGAGDLAGSGSTGFDDPPEPSAKKGATPGQGPVRLGQTPVKPQLAGVRYAPILELALEDETDAGLTASVPLAMPAEVQMAPAVSRTAPAGVTPERLPVTGAEPPAFVPMPATPTIGQGAELASDLPKMATAAANPLPVLAVAAVPQAAPVMAPAKLPAIEETPSLPRTESMKAAVVAAPPPMRQIEAMPAQVPARSLPAAAAPAPALAVAPAPVVQAQPAARGAIEQLSPARIAAARPAPSPVPAPKPVAAAPVAVKVAPAVAAAAPGTRAPVGAPVKAAAPAAQPVSRQPVAGKPAAAAPASAPALATAAALPMPKPVNPTLAAPPAASKPVQLDSTSRLLTRVDGKTAGAVDFQQTPTGLKVRLGSIVEVLADRYDAAQLARIRTSSAGNAYLSLAELQAQGVPISYDPVYDEFNVGLTDTRPKAARKVHMDQISAPERGLGATGMDQVRR